MSIESWFTGKAREKLLSYVIPTLKQAEELGYWPKGASRKVKAALGKQSVANRFGQHHADQQSARPAGQGPTPGTLAAISNNRDKWWEATIRGWGVAHAMAYGQVMQAPKILDLITELEPFAVTDAERDALATARQWASDFAPIGELLKLLDSRRPKPVLIMKTLSPTVLGNVGRAMGIDLKSIRIPEMQGKWVKQADGTEVYVIEILWPKGTRHAVSRFTSGHNCEACGHRIKNTYNWLPLVADTPNGPVSLWVGHDCARNLFGCEIEGEGIYTERAG